MRFGRSVLAGLIAGVVAGFLVALLRPRGTHPAVPSTADTGGEGDSGPALAVPRDEDHVQLPSLEPVASPFQASWERTSATPGASRRVGPDDNARVRD
jgi:hypothetical protein